MLRRLLPCAALAALALPTSALARTVHGTVVERSHHGHHVVIADPAGTLTAVTGDDRAPRFGSGVHVVAHRRHGRWLAQRFDRRGRRHGALRVEGTITAVVPAARTLTIAGDDRGTDASSSITIAVPQRFDITAFAEGQNVELKVVAQGGVLTLAGIDEDRGDRARDHDRGDDRGNDQAGRARGDDGPRHDEGDDRGDDGPGHDQGDDRGHGNGDDRGGDA